MHLNRNYRRVIVPAAGLLAIALSAGPTQARNKTRVLLSPTGVDANANGQAHVIVRIRGKRQNGRFDVIVHKVDPNAIFEVDLQGVRIGSLTTNRGGNGRARFRMNPRGRAQLLGTDPHGKSVQVRNESGDVVLEADIPDEGTDPTETRCCLPDDHPDEQAECEDQTPDECAAAGGIDMGAGSCFPNPCAGTIPSTDGAVVCCTPDDNGPECESESAAECSAKGGINLGAGSCDPNPCAASTPSSPETIQCCLSDDDSEAECEDRTPEMCAEHGGTDMGPGTCSPNPCTQPPAGDTVRCCLPHNGGEGASSGEDDTSETATAECENRTAEQCAAQGGTDMGPGSCDPNPCS